jgi:threonine/homoserine/homoserine lactone efflux protein
VLVSSAGLATLLVASEPVFLALKLVGAAYLIYLGAQALLAAVRGRAHGGAHARSGSPFRQGVISNLGNPKMAVFFTSLLPQFGSSFASLLALGLLFCTMTLLWLTAYAAVVAKAGDILRRPTIRRAFDAAMGVVFVALGVRLAADRR